MDFDDTPEEAAFRVEARAWLEDHAELRTGDEASSMTQASTEGHIERCQAWQRTLYDGGWAGITWPKEFGGRGGTPNENRIFAEEQAAFNVNTGPFAVAIGMVGPTLIAHGTKEQQERLLDPILRGEELWCQLFSEPGAGSDLAGLSTRAERDGDEFVVNGQKVWNSGAQHSQWGILLARTDPKVPKHKGITYFVVDMETPGIEVRPLRQITGHAHFNETFLDDVRIPASGVVGEVDSGWGPTLTTLLNERALIAAGGAGVWEQVLGLAREFGGDADPHTRQDLARQYTRQQLLTYLGYRVQTATSQGRIPGREASVMKLAYSLHAEEMGSLLMALEGAAATLAGDDGVRASFAQDMFLGQWSWRIGGGTDQIQRNIIGERALGLPREPRLDKDVPFEELPR